MYQTLALGVLQIDVIGIPVFYTKLVTHLSHTKQQCAYTYYAISDQDHLCCHKTKVRSKHVQLQITVQVCSVTVTTLH